MNTILLTGATSLIGHYLLPSLLQTPHSILALSRQAPLTSAPRLTWLKADLTTQPSLSHPLDTLIHLAPLWHLPTLLNTLQPPYPTRLIAIGSTSVFSKQQSPSSYEQQVVQRLAQAETALAEFAQQHNIHWTLLRPTLIYAAERDKNITTIAHFIRRFGFFPLVGQATGLRQPLHADDIAKACLACLDNPTTYNRAYNLSGSETLSYREMVERIFVALNRSPRFLPIPPIVLQIGLSSLRLLPRFRDLTPAMAQRMNDHLVFPHHSAQEDFGFNPRPFQPLSD